MDFITFLQENYQESVANGYKKDFRQYSEFLESKNKKAIEVKKSDVGEYIIWLRGKGIKETTINKKLSLVRKYYKYLRIQRVMLENPFEEVTQLKIYREEKTISPEHRMDILASAETERDRLILEMLITEGIKPVEMISMRKQDVDYNKQMVFLGTKACALSTNTIELIKAASKGENEHILTNQHGKPLKESGIYFILNKYLKMGGEKIKPNDLLRA